MKHIKIQGIAEGAEVVGVAQLFYLVENCRGGRRYLQDCLVSFDLVAIIGFVLCRDGKRC
jgi:hypothetical protein